MALFKKRQPETPAPAWVPTVDLVSARPVVFALANAPVSNDGQVRAAIAQFDRLSERPQLEQAIHLIGREPDILNRPWVWLAEVMRRAAAEGDHHLAAAGLFWACYWSSALVPKCGLGDFMEMELDPIPPHHKREIHAVGVASAAQLSEDFLVVGNQTGSVQAGPLAQQAAAQLGI